MFRRFDMFVVFFFEREDRAKEFMEIGDVDLSTARKLLKVETGAEITAEHISADTGIVLPIMVVYPIHEMKPVVLSITDEGRLDSAS